MNKRLLLRLRIVDVKLCVKKIPLMDAITQFSPTALLNMLTSLLAAFLLGGAIGFERQMRQRTAGLRTNTLVAVGAAVFVSLGNRLNEIHGGAQGAVHVVAYVVSGIGFLGAGAIMKDDVVQFKWTPR